MIDGTYKVIMKTLMGKKYGRLTLYENNNILQGSIDILGHINELHDGIISGGRCRFLEEFVTQIRNIAFLAEGDVDESKVNLKIHTEKFTMPISGVIETENSE